MTFENQVDGSGGTTTILIRELFPLEVRFDKLICDRDIFTQYKQKQRLRLTSYCVIYRFSSPVKI